MSGGAALVLYARVPRAGRVKTRMVPWLAADEALRLHAALLEDSLLLLKAAAATTGAVPFLSPSEPWVPDADVEVSAGIARAAAGVAPLPQSGADLGRRLEDTFRRLFSRGFERVVVIGSDSPTLPPDILGDAFAGLQGEDDVVLGPAEDGGYYLVGGRTLVPAMFAATIPWGTERVMDATLAALARHGARAALLPVWFDVDRPADLERLRLDLASRTSKGLPPERTRVIVEELVRAGRLPLKR